MNRSTEAPMLGATDPLPADCLPAGSLLSKLGHELRSPLNGIIGLSRILLSRLAAGPPDPISQVRQLTLLRASAVQMLRTVDQVVDIARLQSEPPAPAPGLVDCGSVVTRTVQAERPAADARGLRLSAEVPDAEVFAAGDAGQLARLLHELVDNAVKYADGGDVLVRLRAPDDDTVTIEVADEGPAIAAPERSRIFEPFERGDAGVRHDDSSAGLGLYLARELARRLGATLSLHTGPEPAVTFAVDLPRGYAPAGSAGPATESGH